jgi:methylmalonyl-CoA mutase N-terminal domain/subunit
LRTQQIIALESGVARTADPLAGSYYVEALTDELEARARELLDELDAAGGAAAAIEAGIPQRWIAESAYRLERELTSGDRPRVGVNVYTTEADEPHLGEIFAADPGVAERQAARTVERIAARDAEACRRATEAVSTVAREGGNVMPPLIDAARAGATLGELADVFRRLFGEFREPQPW